MKKKRTLICRLCPHQCTIKPGARGLCKARLNEGGALKIPLYGFITALARDPIEKKPLYHFRPGSTILSIGFAGCNLRCPFCQNWHISQNIDTRGRHVSPREIIAMAKAEATPQVAYTYSEPLIHIEFLLDAMKEARNNGVANVLVTNGCINAEAAEEILNLTDAANIDLKCFSGETYAKTLGGDLDTILAFISRAHEKGVHIELTTLVVPGLNDSDEEMDKAADFIAGISGEIPWHLSAYHPDYKWNAPPTDPARLRTLAERARQKLSHVHMGNLRFDA
ncbi:AmmeMemoRadiSam system radical SAM enzyme [Leadbettera azotonutricia]|uniref:Radical SAM domain protein n=1 Tax=Leadbettera azotonutricia (strain ATCC BAA-888 / DSM 13862 / ZAS-9) TaxID=545695 RepID=F5YEZ4_LEAAZ|nr:AmmeMemoRadiSam system radical SAM enzyme [Leadbettera azotonutricia]AEF80287.1 radical SAM domain protein [Leadbettera azotonutricia ZAS-9]